MTVKETNRVVKHVLLLLFRAAAESAVGRQSCRNDRVCQQPQLWLFSGWLRLNWPYWSRPAVVDLVKRNIEFDKIKTTESTDLDLRLTITWTEASHRVG